MVRRRRLVVAAVLTGFATGVVWSPAPVGATRRDPNAFVVAQVRIPRIGLSVKAREGVDRRTLWRGVGHYPGTQMPGQIGNAVFLGHRTTGRAPFANLDRLRRGDRIIVRSGGRSRDYSVTAVRVGPANAWSALAPVPFQPRRRAVESMITLITCHPKGSDRKRLIVTARQNRPPAGA
ncbi:class E sortase [Actinomadura kijaniata]|uniref:class E sortase n=1 Tax=Actinomadura kijaniata TaxID=46161 RepID=UPI003F1B930F